MTRVMLAALAGAVVLYVWNMAAWMVLPLHTPTMSALKDESAVTEALRKQQLETGVFVAPWSDDEADWSNPESDFMKNHRRGPIYSLYYHAEGSEVMPVSMMLRGFLIDLLAAGIAACLLSAAASGCCGGSYANRVGFVFGIGLIVALAGHLNYWNWMRFPTGYTLAFVVDAAIGWLLTGLALAAIVRAPAEGVSESAKGAAEG